LEQLLPEGPGHPFAKTMMAHFDKLGTPLRPVLKYPRTGDQETRFKIAGWPEAKAQNLWELWSSKDFLSPKERIVLDAIEPFDEWEEFALFGCHYVFLLAKNETSRDVRDHIAVLDEHEARAITIAKITPKIAYSQYPKVGGCRRFSSPLLLRGSNSQNDLVGNFGGMGLNNKVNSCDVHADSDGENLFYREFTGEGPSARMCHTLTDLGETGSLLIGGRTHPNNALSDCWLYHKWTNTWERVDDIPSPRYRHSTLAISMDSVLVIGGKRDSQSICSDCFIWNRRKGWTKLTAVKREHQALPLVFGAIMIADDSHGGENYQGLLAGGMTREGIVSGEIWRWSILIGDVRFPLKT
jgi:tRNA wybutosine-synthesizing protein 4